MSPRVSLAVPVRNGAAYLGEALRALCEQDYVDLEIIVSDNASSDGTEAICRSFAAREPRIRYHRLPEDVGAGPNFNRCFQLARGELFKWCAHDDLISRNFVARCVEALDRRPDAVLAYGRTQCIDASGAAIPWDAGGFMPPLEADEPAARFRLALAAAGTCFPIFGLFRVEALRRSTLHRPYYGSDRALLAEMALLGKAILVEDAAFYNREHTRRSINLADQAERLRWHTASMARRRSMEHVNLLLHLVEIAVRHPDVVRASTALRAVAGVSLTPAQLGRYSLDLLRLVSPAGGARLKHLWTTLSGAPAGER